MAEPSHIPKQISSLCIDLLWRHDSPWVVANSFLHMQNFSSKTLDFYAPLLAGGWGLGFALHHLARGVWHLLASIIFVGRSLYGDKIETGIDTLFISHLNRPSDYDSEDQYYGPMPQLMTDYGKSVAILMLNQCRARPHNLRQAPQNRAIPKVICAPYLTPWTEAFNFLRLAAVGIFMGVRGIWKQRGLGRRLTVFLGLTNASARSLASIRIATQISQTVQRGKPKSIVFTYEGHAWERLLCQFIRTKWPEIQLIGYQHSVVLGGPAAILQKFPKQLTPHKILTTGPLTASRFIESHSIDANAVISVGSNKTQLPVVNAASYQKAMILIVPEGTQKEAKTMAAFGVALANAMKERGMTTMVTLRLHPLQNFQWLKRQLPEVASLPSNLIFSEASLANDSRQASWILYRGSSAVFSAVPEGGRPLYLDSDNNADNNDPLSQSGPFRKFVTSVEDVIGIIERDVRRLSDADKVAQRDLLDSVHDYFAPLDEQLFAKVLLDE